MGQLQIYQNDRDREAIARLQKILASKGIDLTDQRGNQSISALVRWLVQQELDRQTEPLELTGETKCQNV